MVLLAISATISVFLVGALILVWRSRPAITQERLLEATAPLSDTGVEKTRIGVTDMASSVTGTLKPLRDLIMSNDEDIGFRLSLAGYRKAEHTEVYVASKMLLPVLGIVIGTFTGTVLVSCLIGGALGFFLPDIVVTQMIARRRESIRESLPDALDLLVICMDAGLGIDQALVRVGEEIGTTSPALADELTIINREQRAGKPRLEAWRSMSERVDLDWVRQFVSMLIQTERFGTPIANSLGQFADSLRIRRLQQAEEKAARTTVKLIFPLVLFIFPSLFVVTLGPAVLNIMHSLAEFAK